MDRKECEKCIFFDDYDGILFCNNGQPKRIYETTSCPRIMEPETKVVGMKYDSEKLNWLLLYFPAIDGLLRVLKFGCKKYAPNNWKKVKGGHDRYLSAIFRHAALIADGEIVDAETGENHSSAIMCNAMFLKYFEEQENENT